MNEIGRAFYDEAGTPVRTAGVGIDVTERQRLEMHLRQAQKMEAIGKLAGGVAHDFNNLLTAIIAFSQMARAQLDAAHPAWADIGEVLKAADSAGSLTRQLLAFSRMQMLRPQVLDLNAVVTRLEAILRRTIGDDTRLVMQLDPQVDHVNADPGQVEQVVMNLVVNARDAMPQGGTITIATANVTLDRTYVATHPGSSAGPQVMIAITDTGSGITEAVKARLFEPFFTTKEQGHGTGLGLATVYGIVKQSGGFIWVDTQVGRGSTFRVYLPRTERDLEAAETTVRVAEGGTETILLVEDQEQVRAAVNAMLTRSGLCRPVRRQRRRRLAPRGAASGVNRSAPHGCGDAGHQRSGPRACAAPAAARRACAVHLRLHRPRRREGSGDRAWTPLHPEAVFSGEPPARGASHARRSSIHGVRVALTCTTIASRRSRQAPAPCVLGCARQGSTRATRDETARHAGQVDRSGDRVHFPLTRRQPGGEGLLGGRRAAPARRRAAARRDGAAEERRLPVRVGNPERSVESSRRGQLLANVVGRLDEQRLAIRTAQEDLAMAWLRDVRVPSGSRFSDVVDPLAAVVTRGIVSATGVRKADLLGHLGWAQFPEIARRLDRRETRGLASGRRSTSIR